jgi:ferric-dicitrate binding protein FerR (iron transport regulator)
VRTARDQRVEIELAGGTLVRLDGDAALTFQGLPDPYAEHPDNTVLALDGGSIQISARPSSKEEFRIDTPAASVYLVGEGTSASTWRGTASRRSNRGAAWPRSWGPASPCWCAPAC